MKSELGPYVVVRPRLDGTFRIAFECPARLRPEGWPPTIPLPREGRTGTLTDEGERTRIRVEAEALHAELLIRKSGVKPQLAQTWDHLVRLWENTTKYAGLSEATKRGYGYYTNRLLLVLASHPHIQPCTAQESDLEYILSHWNYSLDLKNGECIILRHLMRKAVKEKWRSDNPMADIPIIVRNQEERPVILWTFEDVDQVSNECIRVGEPGIAAIVRTMWEIGQRLSDVRRFQNGNQYTNGHFSFKQIKTGQPISIEAPPELAELLDRSVNPGEYLFINPRTGTAFQEHELSQRFTEIRRGMKQYQDRPILMRCLRHTAVVQFALAGCEIYDIASVTGHKYATVHRIIEHYLPRHNALADRAMTLRRKMVLSGQSIVLAPTGGLRVDRTKAFERVDPRRKRIAA